MLKEKFSSLVIPFNNISGLEKSGPNILVKFPLDSKGIQDFIKVKVSPSGVNPNDDMLVSTVSLVKID